MKILLVKQKEVLLDNDVFEKVKDLSWYIHTGYVARTYKLRIVGKKGRTSFTDFLHHFVLPQKQGFVIDHINRNKLDNQKENLRYVEHWQNLHNRPEQSNNTSGVKGVSWNKVQQQWHAYLWLKRKRTHLGYFDSWEEAVAARKQAEDLHVKDFVGNSPIQ